MNVLNKHSVLYLPQNKIWKHDAKLYKLGKGVNAVSGIRLINSLTKTLNCKDFVNKLYYKVIKSGAECTCISNLNKQK